MTASVFSSIDPPSAWIGDAYSIQDTTKTYGQTHSNFEEDAEKCRTNTPDTRVEIRIGSNLQVANHSTDLLTCSMKNQSAPIRLKFGEGMFLDTRDTMVTPI